MAYLSRCVSATFSPFANILVSHRKSLVQVHDRRDEEFMVRMPWHTFPGDGQAVCGKESTNSVGFVPGLVRTRHS